MSPKTAKTQAKMPNHIRADIKIVAASLDFFNGFYQTLARVVAEKIYLDLVDMPETSKLQQRLAQMIAEKIPYFYALHGSTVVGFCGIQPEERSTLAHRGRLAMAILPDYRGQGVGSLLLEATLSDAVRFQLEKIGLHVYTHNHPAIALYQKFGFVQEGFERHYRKYQGVYMDAMLMAKFLPTSPNFGKKYD